MYEEGWEFNVPRTKPEKQDRMSLVNVGDGNNWKHDKEKDVAEDEIAGKHSEFGDLAEEFSSRLRHRVPSH